MADGDGGWVDVSDARGRTRRSGATATLWRDTVIFIGGRNRNADGCAAAPRRCAAATLCKLGGAASPLHVRVH